MIRRAAARCALRCLGGTWGTQGTFPACSLPSDGQSPGQAQNEGPEVSDRFIRLCCSNGPRVSAPFWFLLTLETGKSELLFPRHCNAASQVPEYHQMTIDFLARSLSCRQENCSLARLHVVKKRKSVKCHLKTPVCLADPRMLGTKQILTSPGSSRRPYCFCITSIEHFGGCAKQRRHTGLAFLWVCAHG